MNKHSLARVLAALCLLVMQPVLLGAQVVVAPGAGSRPVVGVTANGLPIVQIATPNGAGVSNNGYTQYNVGSQGLILNNSAGNVQTQLGGYVTGNPNLASGSARVIVNQVVGGTPSQLLGYTEVAGQQAEVVIANPAGIVCNGCGFINTNRGILTTGTPIFGGTGSLDAFHVTSGQIQIGASGLNGNNVDEVDLIARSVAINGKIWANQSLNVVAGNNDVRHDDLSAQSLGADGNAPGVAIDVAQLGGMYAGKIRLVGTEAGVGVNSAGTIEAQSGDLQLSSQGKVTLSGSTSASGSLSISGAGDVSNSGSVYATQNASLNSQGQVSNSGVIAALGNTAVTGASVTSSGALGAGVDTNGNLTAAGNLAVSSTGAVTLTGEQIAGGNLAMSGSSLNLTGAQSLANGYASLTATGVVSNDQGSISAAQLSVTAGSVSNRGGTVSQTGTGDMSIAASGAFDNTGGTVATNAQNATIRAGSLTDTSGQISDAGTGLLSIQTGVLNNTGGSVVTNGATIIAASSINNASGAITSSLSTHVTTSGDIDNASGQLESGGALNVFAANVTNTAGRIVSQNADGLTVSVGGQITNAAGTTARGLTGGVIGGNGSASIQAASLTNSGTVTAAQNLGLSVTGVLDDSSGTLSAGASLSADAASLANANGAISANTVSLTVPQLDNSGGQITANQLSVSVTDLTNHQGKLTQLSTDAMGMEVSGTLDNSSGGVIQTNSTDLTLASASINNDDGTIMHGGTGTLTINPSNGTGSLSNVGGSIVTNGQASVLVGALDNTDGTLASQGAMSVTTQSALNNTGGRVSSAMALTASSGGALTNAGGVIGSGGAVADSTLDVNAMSIDNAGGSITNVGTGVTTVTSTSQIVNSNTGGVSGMGSISGNGDVTLSAVSISNTQGGQLSGANLQITTSALDNTGGAIANVANSTGDVGISTGTLTGASGKVNASRNLSLVANTVQGGGSYSAVNDLTLTLQGDFATSSNYAFNAGHNLTFTLPGTFSNAGAFSAVNGLTINAGNIANSGALGAGGLLTTHSNTLINTGAIVGGSVSLSATQTLSNLGTSALIGATDSAGKLELLSADIENRDDTTATDTQAMTAIYGLGQVVLAGGKDANGNYTNASLVHNQSGLIQSGGDMLIAANQVTNTRRIVATGGQTSDIDPSVLEGLGISLSGCTAIHIEACSGQNVGWVTAGDPTMIGGVYIEPPHGGQWNSGYQYTTYTGVAVANLVTSISPESQIIAGGNLNASTVGLFQNYWSQVAASGNIAAPVTLDQNSWQGQDAPQVQVTYSGEYHYNNYDDSEHNWQLPFGDAPFVGSNPGGYQAAPADIRTYALPAYESSFVAGGALTGTGVTINNTAGNASVTPLGLQPGQTLNPGAGTATVQGGQIGSGSLSNFNNPTIAKATAGNVLSNLKLPTGGLFHVDTAPNAPYLVETNPAFTNQQQFLSSDYYFEQMGMNPGQIQQRLGDGFYEQNLVQDQILSMTGKSVLTNYADTQDEYEALMTSGAALAKSLDLAPGTGLSPEQVANLTSNVVIMQDQVVDGQTVLVPVVYLAQASQQNMADGPVIAATDIDLQNAQTVTNSGTITASNNFSIDAQSIDSSFGTLQAGNQMAIATTGDVNLSSATLNAGSLALQAGGNLILDTSATTLSQISATGATRVSTTLGPTASINVAGDAAIVTGGDFEQNAGNLDVGGSLGMSIGGNWNLGVQQTGETKVVAGANGESDTHIVSDTGSNVKVGGVSSIMVGGDLTATGANISLGGGGTVEAAGNVTLQAASATSTVDSNSSGSDHHGSYAATLHTSDDAVTGTTLTSGDNLAIVSGGNLNITGSSVSLDKGNALLMAAGNVNVGATTETHVSDTDQTGSHSGVGSHTSSVDQVDQSATYADGSAISADGVAIVSGKDINVIGSSVVGTNSVALAAQGNVNILAATDTYQDSEYHDVKHSGLSGSGGIGFSVGSSEQTDQYDTNTVTQSQSRSIVGSVAGNVSISAGSDVHIGGSDIVAGQAANDTTGATGNIGIQAQNITIDPSQDTAQAQDQQTSRSSGLTVGVTGTPLDTARNLQAAGSSGNAYQRTTGVANEVTASTLDTPSISLSYGSSKSASTSDMSSLANSGSTIRGAGNVTLIATGGALKDANGNPLDGDITVTGSTITAGAAATFEANHDVTFQASTDQTQQSSQSSNSSTGISLASPSLDDVSRWVQGGPNSGGVSASPYNASSSGASGNASSTQQTATVVTGNTVVVQSGTGDINVIGSGISGTQGVDLVASAGAINVLAGTDAMTNAQASSSRQVGDLGGNGTGTGFSVGVANSSSAQNIAGQSQSTIRSQVVSQSGEVTLAAGKDVTVQGSDLFAGQNLTLVGQNLNLDPGADATQSGTSQSSSEFGVTLALGGAVGTAVATVNEAMTTQSADANNPRLAALDKAEAGLAVYGAYQAATATTVTNPALIKVTVSVGGGSSRSESQGSATTTDGSTLTAGGDAVLIATGSGAKDVSGNATDGDINSTGTQITAQNVTLAAARDINLQSAQNSTENTSSNSSSSASIGVGASLGGTQNGFTIELAANGAKGDANGKSVTNENTQITAANTVTFTSGRDTNLVGAAVAGNTVDLDVGRNLTITSPQDTNSYESQQASAGFDASICVPPICYGQTVSGDVSASNQTIKDNFQSVGQQSGIYAGAGGFDANVGNHTQLNGGVIASTATADKNTLSTQTFGYTNLQNTADYSGSTMGAALSGSSPYGSDSINLTGGPQFSQTGNSGSGTTYAAASPGTITVRGDAGTGQDSTAGLSRDTVSANGSVQNTFNAQSVANDMAIQAKFGQLATVAVGQIADQLEKTDPLFEEGGAGRDALHAAVAAITAAISGGNITGAVGGSLTADELQVLALPLISQAISQLPDNEQDAARNALNDIVATVGGALGGALAGGGAQGALAGAGSGANNEVYNRQLDQSERQWISDHLKAFEAYYETATQGQTITDQQASDMLLVAGFQDVDQTATNSAQANQIASQYISANTSGTTLFVRDSNYSNWRVGTNADGSPTPEQIALQGVPPNPTLGLVVAGALTGGLAAAPAAVGVAGALFDACVATPVLCGNQAAIWLGDLVAGGAMPAGTGASVAGIAAAVQEATVLNNYYRDGASPELLQQVFNQAATSSTENANSSVVVLGKYIAGSSDSYEAVAQAQGATYFSMSDWSAVQGQLGADQMWNINKAFLDQQIAQGKTFLFTGNPASANVGSYTNLEYQYLLSSGYNIAPVSGGFYRAAK